MQISSQVKMTRLVLGLLSFLPLLNWINWIGHFFGIYILLPEPFYWLMIVSALPILILFVYRLFEVETIGIRSQVLWLIRFLLTGFVALPIFWFFFIWKKEEYAIFSEEEELESKLEEIGEKT